MGWAQNKAGRIRRAVRLALNELGRRVVADIRDSISIPVTYVGGVAIRSDPGEPPFKEYGLLRKAIKYKVRSGAEGLDDLKVYCDLTMALYGVYLEKGTFDMEARPFMAPARSRAGDLTKEFERLFRYYLKN